MTNEEKRNFQETFEIARINLEKFQRRLKRSRFSQEEMLILEAFLFYQKRNKEEIFNRIRTKKMQDPYLEATRNYVLGLTYNHFGKYSFAVEKLKISIRQYQEIGEEEGCFYPIVFLVLTFANQKRFAELEKYARLMKTYKPRTQHQKIAQGHAYIVFLVTTDQTEKAKDELIKILRTKNEYLDRYRAGLLVLSFMLAFKEKRYEECSEILKKYKNAKGFSVQANYLYMKSLFNHLVKGAPLYVYENDFENCLELRDQLEVIKAMSRGDREWAYKAWFKLQKHNPILYGKNFEFNGDSCLFSMALQKHVKSLETEIDIKRLVQGNLSLDQKLEKIFNNTNVTISKEKLIELLWNEAPSEMAMARLRKVVSRFNQRHSAQLKSYQDTYQRVS